MTRRDSLRDLERAIDALEPDGAERWADVEVVIVDPETGEHETPDGEPVDPDAGETILRIGGPPPEAEP